MYRLALIFILIVIFGNINGQMPQCYSSILPSQVIVSVNPYVKLDTKDIWPLDGNGTYLQKISAKAKGKKFNFYVSLTISPYMLEAVAFNDFNGWLYTLRLTPENLVWEESKQIPSIMQPENIIADFLLVHIPMMKLQTALHGARALEKGNEKRKARIVNFDKVIRKIQYKEPIGTMWGHVIITNPRKYRLDIQTAVQ